jgi:hypothetical protein
LEQSHFVQLPTAQLDDISINRVDFPLFLSLTTFTNHVEILNHVRSIEERVFYILYAARERLKQVELRRAFAAQTYETVMSKEKKMSRAISNADRTGDARLFIEFMLTALRDALVVVKKSVGKGVVKSVGKSVVKSAGKILKLLGEFPEITRERLAAEVGLSVRGIEKNLAQLKSAGKIRRVGGRKGGHWEVVKDGGK